MFVLLVSVLLGILPLLGIYGFIAGGMLATVDGLFMSLILLTISGIFLGNALFELRSLRQRGQAALSAGSAAAALLRPVSVAPGSTHTEMGIVEEVAFYEAGVGQPDKSLVRFRSEGDNSSHLITFCGNLKNLLAVGKRVKITYRADPACCTLLTYE